MCISQKNGQEFGGDETHTHRVGEKAGGGGGGERKTLVCPRTGRDGERERDRQTVVRERYRSFIFRALPLTKGWRWITYHLTVHATCACEKEIPTTVCLGTWNAMKKERCGGGGGNKKMER